MLAYAAAPLPAVGDQGPVLAAPSQQLTDVLPQRVLDRITLPTQPAPAEPTLIAPIRVATRPTLDWRPTLARTSEKITGDQPRALRTKAQPEGSKPSAGPELTPIAEAPLLVAPGRRTPVGTTEPTPSEPEEPEATQRTPAGKDPAATKLLPLQAPRREAAAAEPATTEPEPEPVVVATPDTPAKADAAKSGRAQRGKAKGKPQLADQTKQARPAKPPQPLTRSLRNLRSRMRTVLSFYYRQPLNTLEHDPWEIMHTMLAYELHSRVRDGGPKGPYMTAVGHLCFNRPSKRQQMMRLTNGKIDTRIGVGLQGHSGQLMAMLAQCNVSPDYPIRVEGKPFKIRDLIASEQESCYTKTELTFKLIGLGHYLESDAKWLNERGERWDIPRLIKEEREQPIRGAACGGTHRLAGLSLAFRRREARGEPVDGEYAAAARFVAQYQAYAFKLQNSDGSLSTEWFRGRGEEEDIDRRLRTTGHLLEWLVYSLDDSELRSYGTVRAVNYLTNLLATNADHEWHLGSLPHALHALVLYDKRVFRPHDRDAGDQVAAVDPTTNLFRSYPIYRNVMRNSPPERSNFLGGLFGSKRASSSSSRRR